MKYSKNLWRLAAVFFPAIAVCPLSLANHSWGNYHWERAANPVTIELGDNVDGVWYPWLYEASSDWSASAVLDTPIGSGQAKGNCRANDGRVEVCNDAYGNNGWLGIAQIWVSGDHIVKGTAKLNDTYHDYPPYNTDPWRDMVMCQEVGHTFGLGHQDENFNNGNLGTCMDYTNNPIGPLNGIIDDNLQPNAHDYDQLAAIYSHTDGSAGVDSGGGGNCWPPNSKKCQNNFLPAEAHGGPPPDFDLPLPDIDQWGALIATSPDGGQSTFVKDYGNGYRVFTHVTWTLEVAERQRTDRH